MKTGKSKLTKGYIQIYTGSSKGKTTAALGLAFRAMGHGMRTYIGQFMKGQFSGELESARLTKGMITIEQYGRESFLGSTPGEKDMELAHEGLQKALKAMLSGKYDIVVLDELVTALHFKLVTLEEVFDVISRKPQNVELVLTGINAPAELIEKADLVTEMQCVKHYYQKGITARDGIER